MLLRVTCIHSIYSRCMFDIVWSCLSISFNRALQPWLSRYQELNASARSTHPFRCSIFRRSDRSEQHNNQWDPKTQSSYYVDLCKVYECWRKQNSGPRKPSKGLCVSFYWGRPKLWSRKRIPRDSIAVLSYPIRIICMIYIYIICSKTGFRLQ